MNYLNERIGKLYLDNQVFELTKNETKLISALINNKMKTYEELYEALYDVHCKELYIEYRRPIITTVSRIRRKTGLRIIAKNNFGLRLEDNICLF